MIVFAFPILTVTLTLLALDRLIGTHFFTSGGGANAMFERLVEQINALKIERLPVDHLFLNPRNPRKHSELQVAQLTRAIETFGFWCPIVVDEDNNVRAGHARLAAARLLGLKVVPVIRIRHLSQKALRMFALADNQIIVITHAGAGSDAAALRTRAVRDGNSYVLDGQKQFISGAGNEHDFRIPQAGLRIGRRQGQFLVQLPFRQCQVCVDVDHPRAGYDDVIIGCQHISRPNFQ